MTRQAAKERYLRRPILLPFFFNEFKDSEVDYALPPQLVPPPFFVQTTDWMKRSMILDLRSSSFFPVYFAAGARPLRGNDFFGGFSLTFAQFLFGPDRRERRPGPFMEWPPLFTTPLDSA